MKILHIASFQGNIGDIQNHKCFYAALRGALGADFVVEKIEIREFYFNVRLRRFDIAFAEYINNFDLLVLGGGGFFDVRWEQSSTGTSLDISEEFMQMVKVPVLVNAMGYHEYADTLKPYKSFERFIKRALDKKWFVSLRNDGSLERMKRRFPDLDTSDITVVPDNAFATEYKRAENHFEKDAIGMCLTDDLLTEEYNKGITKDIFFAEIVRLVNVFLNKNYILVFFQHTPQDIQLISELLAQVPDLKKRTQIIVAAYDTHGEYSVEQYLNYYRMCDAFVAMRFHANIFSLTQHIPCIALAGHEQIEGLYNELKFSEQCIVMNELSFAEQLENKIEAVLRNRKYYQNMQTDIVNAVLKNHNEYMMKIKCFIKDSFLEGSHNEIL